MKKAYKYISDKDFAKMKQRERMAMEPLYIDLGDGIEISRWVLVPTNRKNGGFRVGAFFAKTEKGWCRLGDYDCWRVVTDIKDPVQTRYGLVRGDFEHGGVCFFGFASENGDVKITANYGGEILVTKKRHG